MTLSSKEQLKFANVYILTSQYSVESHVVFQIANNEKELRNINAFDVDGLSEFSVKMFIPEFDDAQKRALDFTKKVDKLLKDGKTVRLIISNAQEITYSGATDDDVKDLRHAMNDFFSAYVQSYNDACHKGYTEMEEEYISSKNLFNDEELTQFKSTFSQLGYNTGKRVGYNDAQSEFAWDWGL